MADRSVLRLPLTLACSLGAVLLTLTGSWAQQRCDVRSVNDAESATGEGVVQGNGYVDRALTAHAEQPVCANLAVSSSDGLGAAPHTLLPVRQDTYALWTGIAAAERKDAVSYRASGDRAIGVSGTGDDFDTGRAAWSRRTLAISAKSGAMGAGSMAGARGLALVPEDDIWVLSDRGDGLLNGPKARNPGASILKSCLSGTAPGRARGGTPSEAAQRCELQVLGNALRTGGPERFPFAAAACRWHGPADVQRTDAGGWRADERHTRGLRRTRQAERDRPRARP